MMQCIHPKTTTDSICSCPWFIHQIGELLILIFCYQLMSSLDQTTNLQSPIFVSFEQVKKKTIYQIIYWSIRIFISPVLSCSLIWWAPHYFSFQIVQSKNSQIYRKWKLVVCRSVQCVLFVCLFAYLLVF